MNLFSVQRILGLLLMIFSATMLPPLLVSLWFDDGAMYAFAAGFAIILLVGALVWLPVRRETGELRLRDGFLITAMFWIVLGTAGAIPLLIALAPISVTDAVFEAISGITTTGSTVLVGLQFLPESVQWYRQQLQWFGGMGLIILAVALAPMLGIGGMRLYRAETPGPVKDNRLTPRITETAKALWYIYVTLTVTCGVAYWLAGMSPFDATMHAFTTVATGGFSNYDASIGHFDSAAIELICVAFMLIGAMNFALHFFAWRHRSLGHYFRDSEFRSLLMVAGGATIVVTYYLMRAGTFDSFGEALVKSLFQVVSIGTDSGYASAEFAAWPGFVPVLLVFLSFIGGCAMSTGGGIKHVRLILLLKQGIREVTRLVHPSAHVPVRVSGRPVPPRVMEAVWGFFSVYVAVFTVIMLLLMASGLDQVTAFSATAAGLNNLGPGLGDVAAHYRDINSFAKWLLAFSMVMGRLEIFTLLVVLSPAFWKR